MLIVCNGMIRSGSTLQYNYTSGLLNINKSAHPLGFYDDKNFEDLISSLSECSSTDKTPIIKTHDVLPNTLINKLPQIKYCLLYTSPSPRDGATSRMPSSA